MVMFLSFLSSLMSMQDMQDAVQCCAVMHCASATTFGWRPEHRNRRL